MRDEERGLSAEYLVGVNFSPSQERNLARNFGTPPPHPASSLSLSLFDYCNDDIFYLTAMYGLIFNGKGFKMEGVPPWMLVVYTILR